MLVWMELRPIQSEAAKKRAKEERKIKEILVHEQYRNWFTDLVKFRQAAAAHAVYTFPHSLTAFDRLLSPFSLTTRRTHDAHKPRHHMPHLQDDRPSIRGFPAAGAHQRGPARGASQQ
jgi:hypothetical protein